VKRVLQKGCRRASARDHPRLFDEYGRIDPRSSRASSTWDLEQLRCHGAARHEVGGPRRRARLLTRSPARGRSGDRAHGGFWASVRRAPRDWVMCYRSARMTRRPSTSSARRAAWSPHPRVGVARDLAQPLPCPSGHQRLAAPRGRLPGGARGSAWLSPVVNPVIPRGDDPKHVPYGRRCWRPSSFVRGTRAGLSTRRLARGATSPRRCCRPTTGRHRARRDHHRLRRDQAMWAWQGAGRRARWWWPCGFLTSMPHSHAAAAQVDVGSSARRSCPFPELLRRVDAGNRDWASVRGSSGADPAGASTHPGAAAAGPTSIAAYPAWELFPLDIYFRNSTFESRKKAWRQAAARHQRRATAVAHLPLRFHLGIAAT